MKKEALNDFLINENTTVVDAMQAIDNNAKGVVFVVNNSLILKGAVSDGDIRRWILKTGDVKAKINKISNNISSSLNFQSAIQGICFFQFDI